MSGKVEEIGVIYLYDYHFLNDSPKTVLLLLSKEWRNLAIEIQRALKFSKKTHLAIFTTVIFLK